MVSMALLLQHKTEMRVRTGTAEYHMTMVMVWMKTFLWMVPCWLLRIIAGIQEAMVISGVIHWMKIPVGTIVMSHNVVVGFPHIYIGITMHVLVSYISQCIQNRFKFELFFPLTYWQVTCVS